MSRKTTPARHPSKSGGDSVKLTPVEPTTPTRGSSIQSERQDAKGGPAGADEGGAPRGGSRMEPSHQQRQKKKDGGKKQGGLTIHRPRVSAAHVERPAPPDECGV